MESTIANIVHALAGVGRAIKRVVWRKRTAKLLVLVALLVLILPLWPVIVADLIYELWKRW
jgi:hypothetical protein